MKGLVAPPVIDVDGVGMRSSVESVPRLMIVIVVRIIVEREDGLRVLKVKSRFQWNLLKAIVFLQKKGPFAKMV